MPQPSPASPQELQGGYAQDEAYAQELPSGWKAAFDDASQSDYYVNEQTGETQWEAPLPQSSSPQPAARSQQTAQAVIWRMASASGWGPRFAGTYKL